MLPVYMHMYLATDQSGGQAMRERSGLGYQEASDDRYTEDGILRHDTTRHDTHEAMDVTKLIDALESGSVSTEPAKMASINDTERRFLL